MHANESNPGLAAANAHFRWLPLQLRDTYRTA